MVPKPEAYSTTSEELEAITLKAEGFWHRAKELLNLPEDQFVGTNNIRNYILGYMELKHLKSVCFNSVELKKDMTWGAKIDS